MKYFLLFLLAFVSLASARTPIDTVAWERSDSGSKYIKIHAELPREQTLYSRYTPTNMDSGVAIELLDSAAGRGTIYAPVATYPTRYVLCMTAFATSAVTWSYTLKVDTTTVFAATSSSAKLQIRDLEIYADTVTDKLYMRRTVIADASIATVLDSASFTRWGVVNKISWTVTPSNKAKLLGVRGAIQR